MIRQKTTPSHVFTIPFEANDLSAVELVYRQEGKIILSLRENELTIEDNKVTANLTQEQTLRFKIGKPVDIQMSVLDRDGHAFTSKIVRSEVYEAISKATL